MAQQSRSKQKFLLLQAGRGISAILVVLDHATVLAKRRFGWNFCDGFFGFGDAGVDFFFVLSGFIIYYLHGENLGRPSELRVYAKKRLTRIYPVYWLWTLLNIPFYFMFPYLGAGFERTLSGIFTSLLLIPQPHSPIIRAAWSLSYEVWFYILFGLAIWWGTRVGRAGFAVWLVIILIGTNLELQWPWLFFTNTVQLEFILGILAAWLTRRSLAERPQIFLMLGLLIFVLGLVDFPQVVSLLGTYNAIATLGVGSFFLIYGAASLELRQSVRVPKFFIILGDASYSIYLSHNLFLSALGRLTPIDSNLKATLAVIFAVLFGVFSYGLVEKPLLRRISARS